MDDLSDRDLFAMAALQGLLAGPTVIKSDRLAEHAYQIADAMLAERKKTAPLEWPEAQRQDEGNVEDLR